MSDTGFKLKDFGGLFTPTDPANKLKGGSTLLSYDALQGGETESEKVQEIPLSDLHPELFRSKVSQSQIAKGFETFFRFQM